MKERKKELKRQREEEKARKSGNCPECRFPKHPGEDCPCKMCGGSGHKMEDCPKLKPPPKKSEEENFCIECKKVHPVGKCICKLCKIGGHLATECPWLEIAAATILPPVEGETGEEPEVQICSHCRSTAHKMEDCAAYKVAQAKLKEDWCYGCKQYGHTIIDCMDEKQEERNKEIEKEIEEKKKQLDEIDKKMERIRKQTKEDERKVPKDRDTRDYPTESGRKPNGKPKKISKEPEPPLPPPREEPPRGPPTGGGEPPGDDDPSDPDDSDESESESDEEDEEDEETDNSETTEESEFVYDEQGRKIDIRQLFKHMRKRRRASGSEEEIPIKIVRGPRGHRGSKGKRGRKGLPGRPGRPGISQSLDRSVDANVTIDTAGLERTFRDMGESMKDVFASQQVFNRSMKSSLEASAKAQAQQTEALEKLNLSTKQRDHDHMFASIKLYDGKDPKEFDTWVDQIMTACKISGRDPKMVALTKSTGAVTEVILSMKQGITWVEFVEELRRCFSDSKTRVHAAAIFNDFRRQEDNENLRSYIHKYTKLHREATGKATDEDFDTQVKLHFLSRLRNSTIATKISQSEEFEKFDTYSLRNCIEAALVMESKLQIKEMVITARENLEGKDPKVMEITEEEVQEEEINLLQEDKGPVRYTNPNLANLVCFKCGGYGHFGRDCVDDKKAMDQLEDRIVGRIKHSFDAYTPVTLQYMNDMIVKAAKLEISRRAAKKKLEKLKNQKGGDDQDKKAPFAGRGRGQYVRKAPQGQKPPLTPTAPPMPQQQASPPPTTRGRGRGGANVVAKRGGRQGTPPPQGLPQTSKKGAYQKPAQVEVKKEPVRLEPNPFLYPQHLPEIHEITEEDIDNMSQEELDEIQEQMDLELQPIYEDEPQEETQ